jgi:hypothetical protein
MQLPVVEILRSNANLLLFRHDKNNDGVITPDEVNF